MKSLILYSAKKRLTPAHCSVTYRDGLARVIWIRAELYPSDVDDALSVANPMDGETVLNSIPIDEDLPPSFVTGWDDYKAGRVVDMDELNGK